MLPPSAPNSRSTSFIDGQVLTKSPSKVYWLTGFEASDLLRCDSALLSSAPSQCTLCDCVHHSRFDTELLDGLRSLWFTTGKLSGFGRKASATSLCTDVLFNSPLLCRQMFTYPRLFGFSLSKMGGKYVPFVATLPSDLTRPRLDTSYKPSKPTTGFHNSITSLISIIYKNMGTVKISEIQGQCL